jgi:hypothetical protein
MAPIKSRTLIWRVVIASVALSFTGAKQVRAPQTYEGHWCRESGRLDDRPLTISAREILAVDLSCKFDRIQKLNKSVWIVDSSCADESINYRAKLTFVLVDPSIDPNHSAEQQRLVVAINDQSGVYRRCNDR